jgi:hypothetical protein
MYQDKLVLFLLDNVRGILNSFQEKRWVEDLFIS